MMSEDDRTSLHARALFGAISLTLTAFGCAPAVSPPAVESVVVIPTPSASTATPLASSAPVPVASAAPSDSAPIAAGEAQPSPPPTPTPPPAPTAKPKPTKKPRVKAVIVEGRPFLVDGRARLASIRTGAGWADVVRVEAPTDRGTRDALIAHYTDWALAEHASIASFARFALQLMALGAPSALVSRAIEAMADETRHARFGFGLVRALSGEELHPGELSTEGALAGQTTLEGALRLAVREGMIGETLAALELHAAAELAEDPALRSALGTIADEESRHAELAYAFAAWAVSREPRLRGVIEEEIQEWRAPALPVASGLGRWGILDESRRRAVRETGWSQVVRPLATRLAISE